MQTLCIAKNKIKRKLLILIYLNNSEHILFAQMCKKDKTQAKQTYEVFSYLQ